MNYEYTKSFFPDLSNDDIRSLKYLIQFDEDHLPPTTMDDVAAIICRELDVDMKQIRSRNRVRKLSDARKIIAYIIDNRFSPTLTTIGNMIMRNHSSVLYCKRVTPDIVRSDVVFAEKLKRCLDAIK